MRFIAFDTETTGFLPGVDQIVEIGAIRFNMGVPEAAYATLINPGRTMPEAASRVSGITDDMLVGKPSIDSVLASFAEFCGDDMIVAHNAPFDFGFLKSDIEKFEAPAPKGIMLDTLPIARKVIPGLANYKLGTLVDYFKLSNSGYHRAEADATYCGQIFWNMIQRISTGGQAPALENLIALSNNQALKFPQVVRQPKQLDMMAML